MLQNDASQPSILLVVMSNLWAMASQENHVLAESEQMLPSDLAGYIVITFYIGLLQGNAPTVKLTTAGDAAWGLPGSGLSRSWQW